MTDGKTTFPGSARSAGEAASKVGEVFGDPEPGYMFKKAIEAVKSAVRVEQVAAEYGEFKLKGAGRLEGRCFAPDHEDRTPSLSVYTETDWWTCYGCGLRGDAVDLERVAGRHVEAWTAVIALSERYGVELPRRPARWHERNAEKGRRWKEIRRWRTRRYQRRLYRLFAADAVAAIPDEDERATEARRAWDEAAGLARAWAARSMGGP